MTLLNASGQAQDPVNNLRRTLPALPDGACLRCGGFMIQEHGASWEWKDRGPGTSLRCVNCGNCLDLDILTNRGKRPLSARPHTRRARPPKGPS